MEGDGGIRFLAGDGVGVITLPGMKLPVGEAAINPVPRRMIEPGGSAGFPRACGGGDSQHPRRRGTGEKDVQPPAGRGRRAVRAGDDGVVRPMSEEALKETIRLELSVRKSQGAEEIGLVFGSQGEHSANALFPHAGGE